MLLQSLYQRGFPGTGEHQFGIAPIVPGGKEHPVLGMDQIVGVSTLCPHSGTRPSVTSSR